MQNLTQNLHYSLRMLRKNLSLTIAVMTTLALGIGATTAIYTVVYATLLAPLPFPHPEQLVMVWSKVQTYRNAMSAGDFLDWQQRSRSFQSLCAWTDGNFNLGTQRRSGAGERSACDTGLFQHDGTALSSRAGTSFPKKAFLAVTALSSLLTKYGLASVRTRTVVGKQLRINGDHYTVVGVLAPGVPDRYDEQLMAPAGIPARTNQSRLPLAVGHGASQAGS